jgi:hypothetical protein
MERRSGSARSGTLRRRLRIRSTYANGEGTKVTWENGGTVTLGPVTMLDVALPADVTDEVVVGFDTRAIVCGGFGPPQQSGVLIDDLRLE